MDRFAQYSHFHRSTRIRLGQCVLRLAAVEIVGVVDSIADGWWFIVEERGGWWRNDRVPQLINGGLRSACRGSRAIAFDTGSKPLNQRHHTMSNQLHGQNSENPLYKLEQSVNFAENLTLCEGVYGLISAVFMLKCVLCTVRAQLRCGSLEHRKK
jgi:hypothetical protein